MVHIRIVSSFVRPHARVDIPPLPVEKSAEAEAHGECGEDAAADEDERDLAVRVLQQGLHRIMKRGRGRGRGRGLS